jgi:hypothetical protein
LENRENENPIIQQTLGDLRVLIEENLNVQMGVIPVYKEISRRILDIFSKEEELAHLEAKDLIKLLDLSNKAQLAPIEQITKLVQALSTMYDRSQLKDQVDNLKKGVAQFKEAMSKSGITIDSDDYVDVDDLVAEN